MRQLLQRIADQQRQGHPAIVQQQALEALVNGNILPEQLRAERRQFRPEGEGSLQIGAAQRVLFHTDEMQPGARRRAGFEQLPGTEKVQSGTKAGFADHQALVRSQGGKTLLQAVLFKEHVAGFVQARLVGEIHVVEDARVRATLVVPVNLGMGGKVGQYAGHGLLDGNKAVILAHCRMSD